jgi:hypothetical protein
MAPPEVRTATEFTEDPAHPEGLRRPHLHLLAQLTDPGQMADHFRITISSAKELVYNFKGSDLFTHAVFTPFSFS